MGIATTLPRLLGLEPPTTAPVQIQLRHCLLRSSLSFGSTYGAAQLLETAKYVILIKKGMGLSAIMTGFDVMAVVGPDNYITIWIGTWLEGE